MEELEEKGDVRGINKENAFLSNRQPTRRCEDGLYSGRRSNPILRYLRRDCFVASASLQHPRNDDGGKCPCGRNTAVLSGIQTNMMTGQFVRFGMVGAINTFLDFGVYVALTRSFTFWAEHILIAATVSFAVAVTSSFILNNYWTFRSDSLRLQRKGVKFLLVAIGGLGWNLLLLASLTTFGFFDIYAKIIATGLVMIWNFILQKYWTFKA